MKSLFLATMMLAVLVWPATAFENVKSTSSGCPAAAGDNVTADYAAVQCHMTAASNAGYGTVWFPCGTYRVEGPGLIGEGVVLQGENRGCAWLRVNNDQTAVTLHSSSSSAPNQSRAGMFDISVECTYSGSPTTSCVIFKRGTAVDGERCNVFGGNWAMEIHSGDGIIGCWAAGKGYGPGCTPNGPPQDALWGCGGNVFTDNANWHKRAKDDAPALQNPYFSQSQPVNFCIYITTSGTGSVTENTFDSVDCSNNAANSLVVYDNGSNRAVTSWYGYGPMSAPIYIASAFWTSIHQSAVTGGYSAGYLTVSDSFGFGSGVSFTGPGPRFCANNINIMC